MTYLITLEFTGPTDIPQAGSSRSGIVVQQLIAHLQQSAMTLVEALPVQSHSFTNHEDISEGFVSNDTLASFVFEVEDASVFSENHHYLHYVLGRLREEVVTVEVVYKQGEKTVVGVTQA
jgi:hypothetical protein